MSATISDASQSASGRDRFQADGPVALAGAGHADDVEFDAAAKRMPGQRISHPPLDFIEGRRGFGKISIEIHLAPPVCDRPAVAAGHPQGLLLGPIWLTAG